MDFLSILKQNKVLLLVLLICVAGRLIVSPYPFDEKLMDGGDTSAHVHMIELIKNHGLLNWDPYWFGGVTVATFYPPLAYLITASFPFSEVMAFKFSFLLFFAVTPIAFYLFVREMNLPKKEALVSTVIFSFIMHFNYLYDMGTFTSMVALPFGLLSFKYFIRTVKSRDVKYIPLSSILLGITILCHAYIGGLFFLLGAVYFLASYYTKPSKATLLNSLSILVFSVLIISLWGLPFLIESGQSNFGWPLEEQFLIVPLTGIYRLFAFYINGFSTIIAGLASILVLSGFAAVMKKKDADSRFLIWASIVTVAVYIAIGLTHSLLPQGRAVLFFSIPFAILIAKNINFKVLKYLLIAFIAMQIMQFTLTPVQTSDNYTKYYDALKLVDKDVGRVNPQPDVNNAILFMAPAMDIQTDGGQYDWSLSKKRFMFNDRKVFFECIGKYSISDRLFSLDGVFTRKSLVYQKPCELINENYTEYFRMLNIHYIIADKRLGVSEIFDSDSNLTKIRDFGDFSLYEFKNASYIDTSVDYSYQRVGPQKILITLKSDEPRENVRVRVSESWYLYWFSNDSEIKVESDDKGFITFVVPRLDGEKSVMLEFREPEYYKVFWAMSAFGVIMSFAPFLIKKYKLKS